MGSTCSETETRSSTSTHTRYIPNAIHTILPLFSCLFISFQRRAMPTPTHFRLYSVRWLNRCVPNDNKQQYFIETNANEKLLLSKRVQTKVIKTNERRRKKNENTSVLITITFQKEIECRKKKEKKTHWISQEHMVDIALRLSHCSLLLLSPALEYFVRACVDMIC